MRQLFDRIFLLLFCMLSLCFVPPGSGFVPAFLAAIAVSAMNCVSSSPLLSAGLLSGYGVFAFWFPECAWFVPLMAYDLAGSIRLCRNERGKAGGTSGAGALFEASGRAGGTGGAGASFEASGRAGGAGALFEVSGGGSGAKQYTSALHGCMFQRKIFAYLPAVLLLTGSLYRLFTVRIAQPVLCSFILVGILLAVLLCFYTDSYETLHSHYIRTRDDDTEIKLLLEERNQSLLEKQDNEIYLATLRERNRIAREIHDNVGHMLTRSILLVGALRTVSHEEALQTPLEQLDGTLNQAMDSIRQSVHDLHDSSVNLQETLEGVVQDFTFCPVTLTCQMSPELPRDVVYGFISITREGLVNIARHSNATLATVSAVEHPGFYQLIIQDNGTVQDGVDTLLAAASGIGLKNMFSRVHGLHGNMHIDTQNGFRIYITVPKKEEPI